LQQATHEAREWSVDNGGRASDIEDYQTSERDAEKLINLFTQR
jgi:hypothetical protein